MTRATLGILLGLCCASPLAGQPAGGDRSVPQGVWVRAGYRLTVAAVIKQPRFMEVGPDGTLFVSIPSQGRILSCRDADKNGYFEEVKTFATPGETVHGLFWHQGWLWWTLATQVGRARDTEGDGIADESLTVIPPDRLPPGSGHWWRSILIHKGRIYTGIGDSENISDETRTRRQKIWSYALDGTDEKLFCSGIRNTEKLVLRPGTNEIWGMDHGSDYFGRQLEEREDHGQPITDLNPPDEMNRYMEGGFYGHPFVVGLRMPRFEYMNRPDIVALAAKTIPPEWPTGAHWAPNAMEFYTGEQFPGHKGDAFVAYHGSWNRTRKGGYCVTRVLFENGHPYGEQKYASWLAPGEKVLGRPVDVAVAPDGSLLISDDLGNRIYRLSKERGAS